MICENFRCFRYNTIAKYNKDVVMYYTLCLKNVTTLSRYTVTSDIHESILIMFDVNVTG